MVVRSVAVSTRKVLSCQLPPPSRSRRSRSVQSFTSPVVQRTLDRTGIPGGSRLHYLHAVFGAPLELRGLFKSDGKHLDSAIHGTIRHGVTLVEVRQRVQFQALPPLFGRVALSRFLLKVFDCLNDALGERHEAPRQLLQRELVTARSQAE